MMLAFLIRWALGQEGRKKDRTPGPPPLLIHDLEQQLIDAGVLPDHCTHIVIDIAHGKPVKVYYECWGGSKLLKVDWAKGLTDAIKINVEDIKTDESD